MPWVKTDDQYPIQREVSVLSDAAFRLHVESRHWCARNLTDGFIGQAEAATISGRAKPKVIAELVAGGLWHGSGHDCPACPQPLNGWVFHAYLTDQPSAARVEQERAARVARQHRWLAKRRGQDYDDIDPIIVYQRDLWACWLCKTPVTRGAVTGDQSGPSVDHVIPTSKGGKHTYDNVRCAHIRCNKSRQDDDAPSTPDRRVDYVAKVSTPSPSRPEGKGDGVKEGRARKCPRCANAVGSAFHRNVCQSAQLESA